MRPLKKDTLMRSERTNRDLIIPYAAPYFAYVGLASFPHTIIPVEVTYVLKLIIVTGLLIWARRWYFSVTGSKNRWVSAVYGAGFGVAGLVLWIACYHPFAGGEKSVPLTMTGFYLRLVTAGLVVPVFEELLMRGYVFRFALQWDRFKKKKHPAPFTQTLENESILDVEPGAWSIARL